jgi:hypothetical protein
MLIRHRLLGLFLAAAAMSPLPVEGQTQRDAAREQQIVAPTGLAHLVANGASP